jgi:phosphatidylserine/phosphatidylglycerophosphate/cardiolipin synthase-like enzyme
MNILRQARVPRDRVVTSPSERREAILDVFRRAERRISLSMFRCNDDDILAGLAQATARGVAVDVLMTPRAKGGRRPLKALRKALDRTGATVHAYADPVVKYHAKYLVADDGPAVVASLNFTRKCFERTCDALVVTYDADIVSSLHRLLEADRQGLPLPALLSPRLIVGPERARRQLQALLGEARSSIRLIDSKLSDPELLDLLTARQAAGVIVEAHGSRRVGGLKSHGKIMLVDDRIGVVGSVSLSEPSLDVRRELAIVVDDSNGIATLRRLFQAVDAPSFSGAAVAAQAGEWALC